MSRIAPEQLTFDFEGEVFHNACEQIGKRGSAQILSFSIERLQARKLQAEKERDRLLLEDAAQRVRFF